MARLKIEDIRQEVESFGWILLSENYVNLKTEMHFKCPEGHNNYTSLEKWRRGHKCLTCENNPLKNVPISPVKKNGYRILALDQASITSGYAIFDNEKLVTYGKWSSNGNHSTERITQTKAWVACMIDRWKPDLVVLEDIQLQKFGTINGQENEGVITFKKLAALQGVLKNYCFETGIVYKIVPPATWRAHSEIKGRAIHDNEKIPTPDGWKKIKDIKIGDLIFDGLGQSTKITEIYKYKEKLWEVTFKNGEKIKCSGDHLWSFNTLSQKLNSKKNRKFYTETIKDIEKNFPLKKYKQNTNNILVPISYPVQYEKKQLEIPPYIMGLLIGDGCLRTTHNDILQFSSKDDFLPDYIAKEMNWNVKHCNTNYSYWFSDKDNKNIKISQFFKNYPHLINLSSTNKFIPTNYLQGDIEQRIDLLSGLLDTDGCIKEGGRISFSTVSPLLKDNIIELCLSLGLQANYKEIAPRGYGKNNSYEIRIFGRPEIKNKLFKLPEKKEKLLEWFDNNKSHKNYEYNPIINIQELNYEDNCTCFSVDNQENLFLVGNFIVTHNCRTDKKKNAQLKVKKLYDISVTQDEADAILIGAWAVYDHNQSKIIMFE